MFGIGMPELIIILLVALLVVGPKKLPDLAKSLGKGVSQFRKATDDIKSSLSEHETYQDLKNLKDDFSDTVDSLKPSGLLDIDVEPSKAEEAKQEKPEPDSHQQAAGDEPVGDTSEPDRKTKQDA